MKQSTDPVQWDFSYWMELALNDPEQFESERSEAIDKVIEDAPAEMRVRLKRLQWRVDKARERAASPMAATLEISKMMWDSFHTLRGCYQELFNEVSPGGRSLKGGSGTRPSVAAGKARKAKVIPFPQLVEA